MPRNSTCWPMSATAIGRRMLAAMEINAALPMPGRDHPDAAALEHLASLRRPYGGPQLVDPPREVRRSFRLPGCPSVSSSSWTGKTSINGPETPFASPEVRMSKGRSTPWHWESYWLPEHKGASSIRFGSTAASLRRPKIRRATRPTDGRPQHGDGEVVRTSTYDRFSTSQTCRHERRASTSSLRSTSWRWLSAGSTT